MDIQEFATANGLSQNENGGFYISGAEFGKAKWVEIIAIYFDAINEATIRNIPVLFGTLLAKPRSATTQQQRQLHTMRLVTFQGFKRGMAGKVWGL